MPRPRPQNGGALCRPEERPLIPFHLSDAWFDCWFAAYRGTAPQFLPVGEGKLYYVRDKRKVGPLSFDVVRGATNLETPYFDIAGPAGADVADLPDRLMHAAGADMAEFDYVPDGSQLLRAAQGWLGSDRASIEPLGRCSLVDCTGRFEDWFASRARSDRRSWGRGERRLDEMGATFEIVSGGERVEPAIAEMLEIEASGWKGEEGTAIRDNAADRLFYTELTRRGAAAGALHLAILRLAGEAIAFDYGILSGDRCLAFKAGYREDYAAQSLGHVAAMKHLRGFFGDPRVAIYDNLGNGMTPPRHKMRFATRYETFYRIRMFAPTARGMLLAGQSGAMKLARAARDRVRPKPAFEPAP